MGVYSDTVYPLVLAASAGLLIFGIVTVFAPRVHSLLRLAAIAFRIVIAVQALAVVFAVIGSKSDVFMTLAYLVAALAMLPLLGISRLGQPEAAQTDSDRPVLTPVQSAKVDGGAAALVAVASAVVTWRIHEVLVAV